MLNRFLFPFVFLATYITDQALKISAQAFFGNPQQDRFISLIPGVVDLKYVENLGAAWSLFKQWPQALSIISVILTSIFLITALKQKPIGYKAVLWGLFCGGALGNCVDRVFHGAVIDYIHLTFYPSYPIFNFADMAIVTSVALGAVCYWHDNRNTTQFSK